MVKTFESLNSCIFEANQILGIKNDFTVIVQLF